MKNFFSLSLLMCCIAFIPGMSHSAAPVSNKVMKDSHCNLLASLNDVEMTTAHMVWSSVSGATGYRVMVYETATWDVADY